MVSLTKKNKRASSESDEESGSKAVISAATSFGERENSPTPKRFNNTTLEVPIINEKVLINALAQGLRMGEFFDSLSKKALTPFNDLLRRAKKYINAEEARRSRTLETSHATEKRKEKAREETIRPEPPARKEAGTKRRTEPRFDNYAHLCTAPSEILVTIANHIKLKWPHTYSEVPMKPTSAGPYCRFQNDHLHSIDECLHLRDEIERLIRANNLSEFVESSPGTTVKHLRKGGGTHRAKDKISKAAEPQPPNNLIHTIFWGPIGGNSNRSRRAHLGELQELRGELAMIYNLLRVFKQMILNFEVRMLDTALIGFAGEVIQPMGEVIMSVSLGTEPLRATRTVRLLIVDAPSTYNMIMGRPSMNSFEAVVSTFHMKMKFPVLDRVGERRINPVGWEKRADKPGSDNIGLIEEKGPRVEPEEKDECHVQAMKELKVVNLSE
ncbi:PREDICTED: uncharacterized protein LOC105969391 [Erythranthe guttata]|uniref:uncharacterized protein LOC105969391 n=1 Tax=Erythranthe guttata TaxID=4155 RepID=UPI00064D8055|nr:PREDICTED: uncharacterized protein LOC105969391 [Erythranthe guttata]|eukprot:XP_012849598.1 PREDICTED: uncharacterized protein LOC105969391 [Erythranthe guttata]